MIQAQELRLCNKVYNQTGEIITVQQILHSTVVYDTEMKIGRDLAQVTDSYEISFTASVIELVKEAEYHELGAISITPETLQKCGFKNFHRVHWFMNYGSGHVEFELTDDGLRLRQPTATWISISYVHQLQNFIFALTGKEIKAAL